MALISKEPTELERIHLIAEEMEPQLAAAFEAAILALRDAIDINVLLAAIVSGDQRQIEELMSTLPTYLQPVQDVITETLIQAAIAFTEPLSAILGGQIAFDVINPRVVEWMRENAAAFVTNISEETLQALRSMLERAAEEGLGTADVATLLRDMIGLNERQANALYNYWAGLVEQGVGADEVIALTDAYAERLLTDRAEMIAQTEIVHAANEGQQQLWEEAAGQGLLDRETTLQEWITTEGACEICDGMDGQQVGLDEPFVDEEGEEYDQPPAHPHCRCAIGLVFGEPQ